MAQVIDRIADLEKEVRDLKRLLTNAAFALEDNARLLGVMREARQGDPGLALALDSIVHDMRKRSDVALKGAI